MRLPSLSLCYHAVSDLWPHRLAVSSQTLAMQLVLLRRLGYASVSGVELPQRQWGSMHVTFDDGYRSVLAAVPMLEHLGVRATLFVPTAFPGSLLDHETVRDAPDEYRRVLTWGELRDLPNVVSVGSHTVTHRHLTQLTDSEVWRELAESKEAIEAVTGRPCRLLAYPFGDCDVRVRRLARCAGYEVCFALAPKAPDHTAMPRTSIFRHDTSIRFVAKIGRSVAISAVNLPRLWRAKPSGQAKCD